MKAIFQQSRPGYAEIIVEAEGAAFDTAEGCAFSLQRSSDRCFMGRGSNIWTQQEDVLTVPCAVRDGKLVFSLDPAYVNNLAVDTYRMQLHYARGVQNLRMRIDAVQAETLAGGNAVAGTARTVPEPPVASAAPLMQSPAPPIPPAPLQEENGTEALLPEQEPKRKKSSLPLVLALIAALCLAGAGAGWYFWSQHIEQERLAAEKAEQERKAEEERLAAEKAEQERLAAEKAEQERKAEEERIAAEKAEQERKAEEARLAAEKAEQERKAEEERLAAEKAEQERLAAEKAEQERKAEEERIAAEKAEQERLAAEKAEQERLRKEAEAAAARADARGRARVYLSSPQRTPLGAWELSKELDKETAEQQDAVYRLLYFAANGNVAEAFVSYARCLDPAEPAWGSIKKDALEAWEYYKKAGTPEAVEAMKKMKEWTDAAAKAGNKDAAAWLRQMK